MPNSSGTEQTARQIDKTERSIRSIPQLSITVVNFLGKESHMLP